MRFGLLVASFCSTMALSEVVPLDHLQVGKMVVNQADLEKVTIYFGNVGPRPLVCKDFRFQVWIAELSRCGDPLASGPVPIAVPTFQIESNKQHAAVDIGADGVRRFKLANGITESLNYCDGVASMISGSCEYGCLPGLGENKGECLPFCSNGLVYGSYKAGKVGCYYRILSCSRDGESSCTQSYRPGPGCPAIANPDDVDTDCGASL